MSCPVCDKIKANDGIIYEDEKAVAFISDKPMASGHIIIMPKVHTENIEDTPKELVSHLFTIANNASSTLYELSGGGQIGTNIILNEGKGSNRRFSHLSIDVIPRQPDDKLNFRWTPKPSKPKDLDDVMKKLKDETFFVGKERAPDKIIAPVAKTEKIADSGENNYLVRQLRRMP